jgi:hypothetical protein
MVQESPAFFHFSDGFCCSDVDGGQSVRVGLLILTLVL